MKELSNKQTPEAAQEIKRLNATLIADRNKFIKIKKIFVKLV